ncbi:MAG: alpha/beta fold hydrolase [Acidimicrobiales bacterium]
MLTWPGADGITIAGDAWGPVDGPLVILQHGGGQTRHAWKGAGQILGDAGYRAVAIDARGHGDSSWSEAGHYDQRDMVNDLVSVIDALGGHRPVLVGASMGGGVSLHACGDDLVDATALVLVDIAPRIEPDGADRIIDFMRQAPDGFASLDEVAEAIASYQPHRPRPRKLDGLAKNVRLGGNGRYYWHWDPAFIGRNRELDKRTEHLEACARRLTLPTLLVRGGLSDILSMDGAQSFLDSCPHAEFVNVTDAAHMVAGDRNDIFTDAVIEFLARTVPADGEPKQPPHQLHPRDDTPGGLADVP